MNRASSLVLSCLGCVLITLTAYASDLLEAVSDRLHSATGSVAAVNVKDSPPTILVKSRSAMGNDVVIGAVVRKTVPVMRGKLRIALDRIRVGEKVTITYVKTREGLIAQSIVVHSK